MWLDRAGQIAAVIPAPPGSYKYLSISPDGLRVAAVRELANAAEIWQIDTARGVLYVIGASGLLHAFRLTDGSEAPGWPVRR